MTLADPTRPAHPRLGAAPRARCAACRDAGERELFAAEPEALSSASRARRRGCLMDFSRQRLDEGALGKLFELADAVGLRVRIDAMWRGDHINTTEDRAVLHVALRQPPGAGIGGADIEKTVLTERARMLAFAQGVRSGSHQGQRRRAVPAGGQHRYRRLGPGAGNGGAGIACLHRRCATLRVRL